MVPALSFALALMFISVDANGKLPANKLDTAQIRKTYLDGDFELAIEFIEDAQKYGGPFSHADSVFIFKLLGVMYAAKYETREKGKHYMVKLLTVEPTAKILDMYASDMIYMIFKNIKDEFDSRHGRFIDSGPAKLPEPEPRQDPITRPRRNYAWVGWTAGALAAAGGLAVAMHLLEEKGSAKVNEEVVP